VFVCLLFCETGNDKGVGNAVGEVQFLVGKKLEVGWRSCYFGIGGKNKHKEWINTILGGGVVAHAGWSMLVGP
jgi:hypothetical protein